MGVKKFTRTDIQEMCRNAGLSTRKAANLTDRIINGITAALAAGGAVELRGLGTLETRERNPRARHNPQNMARVELPARRVVFFKPSGKLKEAVNNEK